MLTSGARLAKPAFRSRWAETVLLLALCSSMAGCSTVQPSARALASAKEAAMRGGYRADLDGLAAAADAAAGASTSSGLAAMGRYWASYARWQRAMNAVNLGASPISVKGDVRAALEQIDSALAAREDFADGHALAALIEGWLTILDSENLRDHAAKARAHMARAKALEPENPRVVWAEATALFGTPRQFGGDPEKALTLFRRAEAMADTRSLLGPGWGHPEALMSKAYVLVNLPDGDLKEAQAAALEALRLRPDWYYVRELLLPLIQRIMDEHTKGQ